MGCGFCFCCGDVTLRVATGRQVILCYSVGFPSWFALKWLSLSYLFIYWFWVPVA